MGLACDDDNLAAAFEEIVSQGSSSGLL